MTTDHPTHLVLPEIAYRTVASPLGPLLVASTDLGLVRLAFTNENDDAVLQSLSDLVSPRIRHNPGRLDVVARELDEYFNGSREFFDLPLDRRLSAGFRERVHRSLADIPYGKTMAYGAMGFFTVPRDVGWRALVR